MLALIPYPFTDPKFSIDADSMRMVSRLICHQILQCQLERNGQAKSAKKADQPPPKFLNHRPTKAAVFGPYRGISRDLWKNWFGSSYGKTRKSLVHKGIIETNKRYSPGKFSKSYRLGQHLWNCPLVFVNLPGQSKCSSIDSNVAKSKSPYGNQYLCAESHLKKFHLPNWDVQTLNRLCDEHEQKKNKWGELPWGDLQRYSIIAIQENRWWSKVDGNHRHHTPLTTLSSDFRKHLICGVFEEVDGWDFKNFQPTLLQFYRETGITTQIPQSEHDQYFELCKSGNLYEFIAEKMGKKSRNDVKKPLLAMLNIENERMVEMPIWRCLSQWFPIICSIIFAIKQDDHRNMAAFLQRKEAEIIYGHIVKKFMEYEKPFFTVHDSVITTKNNCGLLREIFKEVREERRIQTREDKA